MFSIFTVCKLNFENLVPVLIIHYTNNTVCNNMSVLLFSNIVFWLKLITTEPVELRYLELIIFTKKIFVKRIRIWVLALF